ncbi:MAG: hypothetical protein C4529_06610 [Deltaproteobacteria bacterium]|nr:MAG: hypothetical protein C4529_06610 [Deltaproteobacteria bacterium]
MGQEELVRHLIRTAEKRRDEILARGREDAGRIAEEARRRAEAEERDIRSAAGREADRMRRSRMSRARMEAGALLLRARTMLADSVLARLEERLSALPRDAEYPALVDRLYNEILPEIPEGNVLLRADRRARERLGSAAPDPRFRFEALPEEEIGGVEAVSEDGAFLLRNTLRSRFAKARPELMVEIRRRLPGPDE